LLASEAGELLDYAGAGGVGSPQVFFLAERPSRSSDWKLRAGKRANAEWQFRTGKRSPPGGDGWQFRAGKRFDDAVMDDFKRSSWMLRTGKRSDGWKFRGGKRTADWKLRAGKRSDWQFRAGKRSGEMMGDEDDLLDEDERQ